jgi:glyoxylase-like metal-dependent hydrolase (beta-lactamase superfamily II)
MFEIITITHGPVETNTYLAADTQNGEAIVIDPAWDGEQIALAAGKRGWQIRQIWLTHAHFDHLAGAAGLVDHIQPPPPVGLHEDDLPLWSMRGGAELFGIHIDPGPRPQLKFEAGQKLLVGKVSFEIRHAPGHTRGHVIFYAQEESLAFCGDVIFAGGIGRTDLPGGDFGQLMESIRSQVLSLPDETRLLSGHGPETTVGEERRFNPFLTDLDF